MARIWSSGFEINTTSSVVEFAQYQGAVTLDTLNPRSGNRCLKISSLSSGAGKYVRSSNFVAEYTNLYIRMYVFFEEFPSAENVFFVGGSSPTPTGSRAIYLSIDENGIIKFYDEDGQIPGTAQALAGRYHCIEVHFDRSGVGATDVVECRIDYGAPFATSSTRNVATDINYLVFGGNLTNETQTTGIWYFDDLAVNDTSGSYQNSWPGEGKIIVLFPNGPGSGNQWVDGVTGASIPGNAGWERVKENPPDDATTYLKSTTNGAMSSFNLDDSGLSSVDTINVVAVSVRHSNDVANASSYRAILYQNSPLAQASSPNTSLNNTTWRTNYCVGTGLANYEKPRLTTYVHPDTTPWTAAKLDAIEAGIEMTSDSGANHICVSTLWVTVDYTPPNTRLNGSMMPYLAGF